MPEDIHSNGSTTANLVSNGWALLPSPYSLDHLKSILDALTGLSTSDDQAVRQRSGAVYAARNVLALCPQLVTLWRTPELLSLLREVLGPDVGLIRGLFFDKPPSQTWALPWHKDLLIAVADNRQPPGYSRPRFRAGVLHTEPPLSVLENMLTLRIHLDAMTPQNGPLEILTASQTTGKDLQIPGFERVQITSPAGAVLAMRPLLAHASGRSDPEFPGHRRVLHLEFSGLSVLPEGVRWHTFHPVFSSSRYIEESLRTNCSEAFPIK